MKSVSRNWVPLYVMGKEGFVKPLQQALYESDIPFMPGYLYDNSLSAAHSMIWIDDKTPIRDYKSAIGGKLIWKYRLHFFSDLDEFTASSKPDETLDEAFETAL